MRRREFIAGFGSAAAWPVVARAQQPATPVVAYVSGGIFVKSMSIPAACGGGLWFR
jgi:hypothetical protein